MEQAMPCDLLVGYRGVHLYRPKRSLYGACPYTFMGVAEMKPEIKI